MPDSMPVRSPHRSRRLVVAAATAAASATIGLPSASGAAPANGSGEISTGRSAFPSSGCSQVGGTSSMNGKAVKVNTRTSTHRRNMQVIASTTTPGDAVTYTEDVRASGGVDGRKGAFTGFEAFVKLKVTASSAVGASTDCSDSYGTASVSAGFFLTVRKSGWTKVVATSTGGRDYEVVVLLTDIEHSSPGTAVIVDGSPGTSTARVRMRPGHYLASIEMTQIAGPTRSRSSTLTVSGTFTAKG